jgi:O-methyltransferase
MNCIFICVFNQEKYVDMFFLLLESIFIYGKLDDNTNILVYTSTPFMDIIKKNHLFNDEKIKFEINDEYNNIDKACKSRLDLFNLSSITNYDKILYLDTDILVKDDINKVFDVCKEDILYVLEEGYINDNIDYWGKTLFGNEISNYNDKSAFSSGILLFNNCEIIRDLFNKINEDIVNRPYNFVCFDQPYIVYNAFKYNLYNNKLLKSLVVNNDFNIKSDKVIHHFPGGPGIYQGKIDVMTNFLNSIKNKYKIFIERILSGGFTLVSRERLENLYKQCSKFKDTNYSFVECGVAKGGCLSMMNFSSGKNNKIFGFDSFEGMPDITKEDIDDYNKSCPKVWVNVPLCNGINDVYNTFNKLNLNMDNVTLVKGFFQDTLQVQENIDNIGEIAVLRLDGDWYESTKICLDKLYDKVIDGGIIIIDDYGHFIGAKQATDEFRIKHKILTPLIKTDYTEYFWIKEKKKEEIYIIQVGSHIGNTSNDYLYNQINPNFKYIMIEPVLYLFNQLKENYKSYNNIIFLNIAISNYNGIIDLYVPSEKNDFSKLVNWTSQLASINKEHISTFVNNCIIDKIPVECKTLNTLIKEYNITELEYLYTDTEGHDYDILMDLDLLFIRPKNIIFENKHMDGPKHTLDINNCPKYFNLLNHFKEYGYDIKSQNGEDTHIQLFKTCNIEDDIWTCSSKMRHDIYDFFKEKSHFKIAEIGSHKGYSTKVLSKIFSKVYAVDNSIEWTNFNKNFNKDATNIEYVMLDIYRDSWGILPEDIDISFIDADHSYNGCKSDIVNSIKQFKNLKYIIFDDYGVWSGVKQIVDELIKNKTLIFEKFIGINDVPGPNGIVTNVNEGIICSINNKVENKIVNNTYTWENSYIKFLDNFKMHAFGEGYYKFIDKQNIIANFGGRNHNIKFNDDYTNFLSTRNDDLQIVVGILKK